MRARALLWQFVVAYGVLANTRFLAVAQTEETQRLFEEAVAAQSHGATEVAASKFGELLAAHPNAVARVEAAAEQAVGGQSAAAKIYLVAGQTRLGMGQYDLAGRDADAAQRLYPKLTGLATLQGMILEQTADYDDALTILSQVIATNPNDYNAQFYLGAIYYFKRDMTKAQMHLTHALQLQPSSVQARYELALVDRANGHLDAALKGLQKVLATSPNWLEPHVELAALYYRLGRPAEGARERQTVDRMMATLQQSQAQSAH